MLLAIDIGNTNIVLGVFKNDELLYTWRLYTDYNKTIDEYKIQLHQLLSIAGLTPKSFLGVVLASVVPQIEKTWIKVIKSYLCLSPLVITSKTHTGITIHYKTPTKLGIDRLINVIAAYYLYNTPAIVIDLGTANTFDVISKNGEYLGGAIAPGIFTSAKTLFSQTAKLPKIELKKPSQVIGKTTTESLLSGIIYGAIGQIDGIVKRIIDELDEKSKKPMVIATGGMAEIIAADSEVIDLIDLNLTLKGLCIIYKQNAI